MIWDMRLVVFVSRDNKETAVRSDGYLFYWTFSKEGESIHQTLRLLYLSGHIIR